MNEKEKTEWEKEEQRRNQEFFVARNKKQSRPNSSRFYRKRLEEINAESITVALLAIFPG